MQYGAGTLRQNIVGWYCGNRRHPCGVSPPFPKVFEGCFAQLHPIIQKAARRFKWKKDYKKEDLSDFWREKRRTSGRKVPRRFFWRRRKRPGTRQKVPEAAKPRGLFVVDANGIEPLTLCTSSKCSTSWAKRPYKILRDYYILFIQKKQVLFEKIFFLFIVLLLSFPSCSQNHFSIILVSINENDANLLLPIQILWYNKMT